MDLSSQYKSRKNIIGGVAIAIVLLYLLRLFFLQLLSEDYKKNADSNAFRKDIIYPSRGLIYDRNGKLMVFNEPIYNIMVTMNDQIGIDTLDFCNTVGITREEYEQRMAEIKDYSKNTGYSPYTPQLFMSQIPPVGGATQKDKIEVMVNIDDTSCFGYHDSGSSNVSSNNPNHNDKAALVAASVIDEWANSAEAKALGIDLGEPVVDKWNRSFLGFDLAIKEGTQAYAKDGNGDVLLADYSQAPGQPKYAWDGQKVIPMTEAGVLLDKFKHILKGTGAIGWLDRNSNFYVSADKVTLGQTSASLNGATIGSQNWNDLKDYVVFDDAYVDAQNPKAKVLNLKRIMDLVNDDYLPINNKNLQEWVKVGKSDGYFSDWIVTLTKAERKIKEEKNIWTYAFEDSNRKSDYDMNDVVIKVQESLDGNTLTFKLVAAGCEYSNEVYFNGTVVTWNNGTTEVHDALGVGKGVLTNTKSRTGVDGMSPATATFPKPAGFDYQTADIKIMPSGGDVASRADGGDGFVHLAETGKQPTGIVIPYDWAWPTERKCIVNCYNETGHSFASWAAQENVDLRTVSADWFKYPTADTTK